MLDKQRKELLEMLDECQHIKGEPVSVSEIVRLKKENEYLRERYIGLINLVASMISICHRLDQASKEESTERWLEDAEHWLSVSKTKVTF